MTEIRIEEIRKYVYENLGIYFSPERTHELERHISNAAKDKGFAKDDDFINYLFEVITHSERIFTLARYLTIGETYFFREIGALNALKEFIIEFKEKKNSLNIWSAGCCSGEEPYTLAIMIKELFGEIDFDLNILGTDINPYFLEKAKSGIYGKWSFRTLDKNIQQKYFKKIDENKFEIDYSIKKIVKFDFLNLADSNHNHKFIKDKKFDIILCRNVIMYFNRELQNRIIENFYGTLENKGLLVLGSAETANIDKQKFERLFFENAVIFRKEINANYEFQKKYSQNNFEIPENKINSGVKNKTEFNNKINYDEKSLKKDQDKYQSIKSSISSDNTFENAKRLFEKGNYDEAINVISKYLDSPENIGSDISRSDYIELLIKAYTSFGKTELAKQWCKTGIDEDKLHTKFYILLANLLYIEGDYDSVVTILKKVIYLEQDNLLAHYYLGNICAKIKKYDDCRKYFNTALNLLQNYDDNETLDFADGITAGRMKELILSQRKI